MIAKTLQFPGWKISLDKEGQGVFCAKQVHGGAIVSARELQKEIIEADGIFLDTKDIVAGIRTADCMPLVLIGQGRAVVLHVSRKTLIAGLLENVPKYIPIEELQQIYIGPHICERHFTFEWEGEEIVEFRKKFPEAAYEENGALHLSLRRAVQYYFDDWKIDVPIEEDGRCTYEDVKLPSRVRWAGDGKPGKLEHLTVSIQRTI